MAQHVPISFPSPGDEVDGVGGVDKVDGVCGGSIVAYDHNHSEILMLILVKHVLVIIKVIVR